jgi:hypothetical protein
MDEGYRLSWEHLRLTIEPHQSSWQAFVYDETACEILYRTERMTAHGAKVSVVEFALHHLFGAAHGQDAEGICERLGWLPLRESNPN